MCSICLYSIFRPLSPGKSAEESDYQNIPFSSLNVNTAWQQKSAFTRTVSPGSVSPIHGQVYCVRVENLLYFRFMLMKLI